jgi:hypothetical protein
VQSWYLLWLLSASGCSRFFTKGERSRGFLEAPSDVTWRFDKTSSLMKHLLT